jgi:hypothetical protein
VGHIVHYHAHRLRNVDHLTLPLLRNGPRPLPRKRGGEGVTNGSRDMSAYARSHFFQLFNGNPLPRSPAYFTPPADRPCTISFWITMVSRITGTITTIAAAARGPQAKLSKVSML